MNLTVYESTSDTTLFHMMCPDPGSVSTQDTPDDDKIPVVAETDDVTPTSLTILKDQVLTSERTCEDALVETLRTPDKNGSPGPLLSPAVPSDAPAPPENPVEDEAYLNRIIDNSDQTLLASDVSINDDDDIFEHQQRKDASGVSILTNPSPISGQRKVASDSHILTLNRLKHTKINPNNNDTEFNHQPCSTWPELELTLSIWL